MGDGVHELCYKIGSGYRMYFAHDNNEVVILLVGGDKSTQQRDIKKAKEFWQDYKIRRENR